LTKHRDLFNAAFVSCWTELSESQQDELIVTIEQALNMQEIPEITQILLNLAEFMEHCDKVEKFSFLSHITILFSQLYIYIMGVVGRLLNSCMYSMKLKVSGRLRI
jgi:phosphatidylinositol kinase/protein kinase (PI-3  family)